MSSLDTDLVNARSSVFLCSICIFDHTVALKRAAIELRWSSTARHIA